MQKLTKAILNVMDEVKGIDKSLTVGDGRMSYQGVPDKEVKKIIGASMKKNGLVLIPTSITPKTQIERWEETSSYGTKQKQSVFTEVQTEYLLMHDSGESVKVAGYGHGVDSQDKGAGKATTYALKYAMLYLFLTPTGSIDDSDVTHSEEIEVPKKATTVVEGKVKPKVELNTEPFNKMKEAVAKGTYSIEQLKGMYDISKEVEVALCSK